MGPFCCTGRTLSIDAEPVGQVGYVYAYGWDTQAFFTGEQSSGVQDLRVLLSGAMDLGNLDNQLIGWVRFRADRDGAGAVKRATVGLLRYEVRLHAITKTTLDQRPYFEMGSEQLTVKVEQLAQSSLPDAPLHYSRCLGQSEPSNGRCLMLDVSCAVPVECSSASELTVSYGETSERYRIEPDPLAEECTGDGLFYDERRSEVVLCPSLCQRVAREATQLSIDC